MTTTTKSSAALTSAQQQLQLLLVWGLVLSCLGFFFLPIFGLAGLALSARAYLLTHTPAHAKDPKLRLWQGLAIAGILAGLADCWALL